MPFGKYRSWILIGAPLILIFNTILFSILPLEMPYKAIVSCIVYALFCISTNIAYTGYTSLNSALTNDPKERVQLSMLRGQGNAAGKSLAGFVLIPILVFFGGGDGMNAKGFFWTAITVGVVCCVGYINLMFATKGKDVPATGKGVEKEKFSVGEMIKAVVGNRNLMLLFSADILRILAMLLSFSMFPFFFKYVVNDMEGASTFFGIVNILAFVGATSVPFITKFLSKRNAYIYGNTMLAICMVAAIFFSTNINMVIVLISIGFIGYAWGNVINTSMYADVVDEAMKRTGKNVRGLYFSMFQLSIKLAAIFSTGVSAFGLALAGYDPKLEPTEKVISGIRFISMGMPAALLAIGAVLLIFYNLDKKKKENK